MSRRESNRWNSKFARFVRKYGVARLATQIEIQPSAIYFWIRGVTSPRRGHAEIIQRVARECGVRLSLDQIYQHTRDRLAVDPGCAVRVPRELYLAQLRETRLRCEGD
jgi:hypothetical protein